MVSLPVADKSNLKDKGTILVYSSVAQSIMVRKSRLIISQSQLKSREQWKLVQLTFSFLYVVQNPILGNVATHSRQVFLPQLTKSWHMVYMFIGVPRAGLPGTYQISSDWQLRFTISSGVGVGEKVGGKRGEFISNKEVCACSEESWAFCDLMLCFRKRYESKEDEISGLSHLLTWSLLGCQLLVLILRCGMQTK